MRLIGCILLLLVASTSCRRSRNGDESSSTCSRQMERLLRNHVVSPSPPDITGTWTSMRCEVRPGPEFILRKYRFYESGRFELLQYYYADAQCTQPMFTLAARGRVRFYGTSWVLPGASEMDYSVSYVTLMPYTKPIAHFLSNKVNSTCTGYAKSAWKPFQRYEILNYVEYRSNNGYESDVDDVDVLVDRDCLDALDFSLHELQLMRLEERRHQHRVRTALFTGDVHTDRQHRREYRPTAFQPQPLLTHLDEDCPVCQSVSNSDEFFPPILPKQRLPAFHLAGGWLSSQCETRPHNLRLTRHVIFGADNRTWQASYHHFYDEICREPMFSLRAEGSYVVGPASVLVDGAYDVDFYVESVGITARDPRIARTLNEWAKGAAPCGGKHEWTLGREQDVTDSKGCPPLGISMAAIEQELLRLDHNHHHHHRLLFMGQRPTHAEQNSGIPVPRPTSFQPPLVRCGSEGLTDENFEIDEQIVMATHPPSYGSAVITTTTPSLILLTLVAIAAM